MGWPISVYLCGRLIQLTDRYNSLVADFNKTTALHKHFQERIQFLEQALDAAHNQLRQAPAISDSALAQSVAQNHDHIKQLNEQITGITNQYSAKLLESQTQIDQPQDQNLPKAEGSWMGTNYANSTCCVTQKIKL